MNLEILKRVKEDNCLEQTSYVKCFDILIVGDGIIQLRQVGYSGPKSKDIEIDVDTVSVRITDNKPLSEMI